MTIHIAVSYFEKNEGGYLLGSDSSVGLEQEGEIVGSFLSEKSFFGKNFIGLYAGRMHSVKKSESFENFYFNALKTLDGQFENIKEGVDYSHVELFKKLVLYHVLIAKKSNKLELFTISSSRQKKDKAKKIHEWRNDELSKVWFSAFSSIVYEFKPKMIFNLEEACELARTMLNPDIHFLKDRNYDPGPAHLYVVNSEGMERLPLL